MFKLESWKEYRLGDLIKVNEGIVNKETNWIDYIDISSVSNGHYDKPLRVKLKDAPSRAKRLLKEDDTVISTVRPYLKAFFYAKNLSPNTVSSTGFAVLTPKKIDGRFLYYLTTSDTYIQFLTNNCTGSAYPAFNPNVIENSKVFIPVSINEQHRIVEILGSLDDKIELNLEMNKSLEEIAMAFYKEWFVDFGPFRNGEFINSELGQIPKGWKVTELSDIVQINNRSYKPYEHPQTKFYHYSIPAFDDLKYPNIETGKDIASNKTLITDKIVLVSKLNPRISRIWTVIPDNNFISFSSTEFINYKAKDNLDWGFLNCLLRGDLFYNEFISHATGTTGSRQRVTPQATLNFKILIPNNDLRAEFNHLIDPLFELMIKNLIENQELKSIRDYLLPKLISGEIRVREAKDKIKESM